MNDTSLPVLGDPPFRKDRAMIALSELLSASMPGTLQLRTTAKVVQAFRKGTQGERNGRDGISFYYEGQEEDIEDITLYSVEGDAHGWAFRRAWRYWVCRTATHAIPQGAARDLNHEWGAQVRVDGFAGGQPVESIRGPIYSYHVDTMGGLQALMAMIRKVANLHKETGE